ncbi:hypothetical protein [Caballeronia sp. dw_19]|uniref:hypothetical protein n=1 Tax=Caballeronia sp. dw_19 TaxID=2719791 RepID=UPI001BD08DB2|nr:hypothetical protein [Caballeronia sp. dw_19]
MENELQPMAGAQENGRPWTFDRSVNLPTLLTLVAMLVATLGSGFGIYLNFDRRISRLEDRTDHVEKTQDEQKADNKEQLTRINEKLDRLLYDRAGVRPETRGWTK